jgi:uncharacterized membrane protein YwaF
MRPQSDFWIMRPFNAVFFLGLGAFLLLLIVASVALRRKSERTRQIVLIAACLVTFAGFFVYKYYLSIDAEFDRITAAMGGFNWWGELPLHLCNINMILVPIAVATKNRGLMSFCFFVGPLGAMLALVMPGNGFDGYSILLPRMLGYYGTHYMVVIECLAVVTFGFYRPKFSDLPKTVLAIFLIALIIFGINMLLRTTGLHPKANYFFTVETEGNPVLDLFYNLIPYPFLYLLPGTLVLGAYAALLTTGFWIADRLREKNAVAV